MNYFIEKQKFSEWWVWIIISIAAVPILAMFLFGIYKQIILGEPWGTSPMSDTGLIITTILTISLLGLIFALFISAELTIEIRDRSIFVRFPPFFSNFKRFGKEDIEKWEVIRYNPITRYGGWGVRYSLRNGKTYNVGGKIGLQLYLTSGKKLLIGTKDPTGLKKAIEKEFSRKNNGDF